MVNIGPMSATSLIELLSGLTIMQDVIKLSSNIVKGNLAFYREPIVGAKGLI
jgi:hypothetical protein